MRWSLWAAQQSKWVATTCSHARQHVHAQPGAQPAMCTTHQAQLSMF